MRSWCRGEYGTSRASDARERPNSRGQRQLRHPVVRMCQELEHSSRDNTMKGMSQFRSGAAGDTVESFPGCVDGSPGDLTKTVSNDKLVTCLDKL